MFYPENCFQPRACTLVTIIRNMQKEKRSEERKDWKSQNIISRIVGSKLHTMESEKY